MGHRYPPNQRLKRHRAHVHRLRVGHDADAPRPAAAREGMKSSAEPRAAAARDVDVELLKAVAQAWHAQSGNPRSSRASGTGRDDEAAGAGAGARSRAAGAARHRPSRFKQEAMAAAAAAASKAGAASVAAPPPERSWDFSRSLWDTYELVSVARKLESGLVIADPTPAMPQLATAEGGARGAGKRGRESGRSLRRMFLRSSSRRFEEPRS